MDPGSDPDRHGFLHTPECNEKWRAFLQCKKEYPISAVFFDSCGDLLEDLSKCLKKERLAKRQVSYGTAEKSKARIVHRLAEQEIEED